MNEHQKILLHLSLIDGIGPSAVAKIIKQIAPDTWHAIYEFSVHDWMSRGMTQLLAQRLYTGLHDRRLLEQELALIEKYHIALVTILDDTYPARLREIYMPPPILYYKGTIAHQTRAIAFVGSRDANRYAQNIIERLIPELVTHNIAIISGGALGADSMAHRATVNAGGTTIVVLGSGLLHWYPYKNKKLFEDILATGGALVSSFPLNVEPFPGNFPARNRIIAGLADGVVVVQAAQKSGTRITAQYALEQGRDVFAVPGSIDDSLSAGCHALIQEGAKLITNAHDILVEYGIQHAAPIATKEQNLSFDNQSIEQQIITLCRQPQSIDELAQQTQKNLHELQSILFAMQMAGTIEQDFVGLWKTM